MQIMSRWGGGAPPWVHRENEAIIRSSNESQITNLNARIKELKAENDDLKKQLEEMTKKYNKCKKTLSGNHASE